MNRIYVICLLLLISTVCAANSTVNVDSLKKLLKKYDSSEYQEQTTEILFKIGNHYYNEQQDSLAMLYIDKALEKVGLKQDFLKGQLLYKKAMLICYGENDFETVKDLFEKAAVLYKDADQESQFIFQQAYGSILITYQEYDNGIEKLQRAEAIFLKHNFPNHLDNMLVIYSNLVAAGQSKEDYKTALKYARKGIEISANSEDYELRANLHYNNANILSQISSRTAAKQQYLKALELGEKGNLISILANANMALGDWHSSEKQPKVAAKYLAAAQKYSQELQDFRTLAILDKMFASNYYNQKNYDLALKYIDKCINYFRESNDLRGIRGNYYEKAKILFAKGEAEKAVDFALLEIESSNLINSFSYKDESYLLLSTIEKSRENYAQALIYHQEYVEVKDSIFSDNLEDKIAEEGTRQNIEAAQEAQQNAELQAELLTTQNRLFGAIAVGLFTILLIGGFLFVQLRKARKQLQNQNLQLIQLNETKDKFFGIIAHDIRSPITALDSVGEQMSYYLAKNNQVKLRRLADRVDSTAKRLSSLLDNLLNWALLQTGTIPYNPISVDIKTVSDEILELYEPIASAKNIRLINNIEANQMVFVDESSLNAILRNLVNNALKFTTENGEVSISIKEEKEKFFIEINDTGTGISAEKLPTLFNIERKSSKGTAGEKGTGLGLMLCKELVELNKGTIKAFSELGKGSKFVFSIPRLS